MSSEGRELRLRMSLRAMKVPEDALEQRSQGKYTVARGKDWRLPKESWLRRAANYPFSARGQRILWAVDTGRWVCWEKENSAVGRVDELAI